VQPSNYQTYLSQNPISGGGSAPGGPQPNGLEKLLPTIGSVGGGILGALIPGLGETGIGEVGGSAAGGALGRHIENMLTGQTGGELGAAAEGGIGAGVGGLLGKAVGGAGKGALGFLASKTAPKAAEDVAATAAPVAGTEAAAYEKPFTDALGTDTAATKLQKQGIDYQGAIDFMKNKIGASNDPEEWRKITGFIAGQPGEDYTGGAMLSTHKANAAFNQPSLAKEGVLGPLNDLLQEHGSTVIEPEAKDSLGQFLSKGLGNALVKNPTTGVLDHYSAGGLQQLLKDVGARYRLNPKTMNPLAQTTEGKTIESEALPQVRSFLDNLVNNRAGVNEAIANDVTSPEQEAAIRAAAKEHGLTGDVAENASKYVIDSMNNAGSAADISAAETPAVHADKIAKMVQEFQRGPKPSVQAAKDVASAQAEADKAAAEAAKGAAKEAAQPHPAEAATANVVNALTGGPMAKLKAAAAVGGGFIPTLNRLAEGGADVLGKIPMGRIGAGAGAGLATLGGSAAAAGGGPGDLTQGGGGMPPAGPMGAMAGGGGGQPGGPTLANGAPLTNPNILAQLDTMMATDPYLAQSLAPVVQQLAGPVTAAQAAQQMLPEYQSTLAQGTQGGGPLGFLLAKISGALTGGPAAQVGPQQQAIQALLTRAGAPGMQVPGLFANPAGTAAGMAPTASVLGALGGGG
jgi:hypothetical protein